MYSTAGQPGSPTTTWASQIFWNSVRGFSTGIVLFYHQDVEIDPQLAEQALHEALERFPQLAVFGPRLVWRSLFQGGAFLLEYEQQPPRDTPGAWDFQNAVVKGYKRLAGI